MPLRRWFKGLRLRFQAAPAYLSFLPRTGFDYAKEVGDPLRSSVVTPALFWIARTFPEASVAVRRVRDDGQSDPVLRHHLVRLIRRPNPFFSEPVMWMATVIDYFVSGDAYWIKIRDRFGVPVEVWWVPSWMIQPKGSDTDPHVFIDHYAYRPGGETIRVPVGDVVHFRFGIDPGDMRRGLSPLASVLREVFTDEEAANFTASILRNMGVPGLVVSPDGQGAVLSPDDADVLKEKVRTVVTGDNRGEPIVMSTATRIEQFGFSPDQMNVRDLRRIPEERVSAVLGVPAVVAGLGAGLDRSTFTNMAEAREMAYESNIIPAQRVFAAELHRQLLPDFEDDAEDYLVEFDLSGVRVLQEDRMNMTRRVVANVVNGVQTLGEGRRELGLNAGDEHDVFYRPLNVTPVPASDPGYVPPSADADGSQDEVHPPSPDAMPTGLLDGDVTAGVNGKDISGLLVNAKG